MRTARTVRKKEVKTERTITNQGLLDLGFYQEGMVRFIDQTNNTNKPVVITSLIGGKNTIADLLWLASKIYPLKKVVQFGVNCAELVSHLNPDSRIQLAINATKDWVEAPTKENLDAALFATSPFKNTSSYTIQSAARVASAASACASFDPNSAAREARAAAYETSILFGIEVGDKIDILLKELFKE